MNNLIIKYFKEIETLLNNSYEGPLIESKGSAAIFASLKIAQFLEDLIHILNFENRIKVSIKKILDNMIYNFNWSIEKNAVIYNRMYTVIQRSLGNCEAAIVLLEYAFYDPEKEALEKEKKIELEKKVKEVKAEIEKQRNEMEVFVDF